MPLAEGLTEQGIGLAIAVHRHAGPGMLESVFEHCLCHELRDAGIPFERQAPIPVMSKPMSIGDGFKADIVVARSIILEINAVAAIVPAHEAPLHTDLRMSQIRVGLSLNLNARHLADGTHRVVV